MIDDRGRRTCTTTGDDNKFLEVTYQNGDKELLYFKDFSSGAMIENIVRRAKKLSIKRTIAGGERGIVTDDLLDSIKQEFREHEDLPNTTNPDDWAKISGKKGERIVYVRTIVERRRSTRAAARSNASPPASTCKGFHARIGERGGRGIQWETRRDRRTPHRVILEAESPPEIAAPPRPAPRAFGRARAALEHDLQAPSTWPLLDSLRGATVAAGRHLARVPPFGHVLGPPRAVLLLAARRHARSGSTCSSCSRDSS